MFTTALNKTTPNFLANRFLQVVVGVYVAVWVITAISPKYPFDWFLENLLVFVFIFTLSITYRRFPFSDMAYLLISIFLCLHAVGAHYTYAEAPAGYWMQDAFGFERNQYDRLVHCMFGLLLGYPLSELILRLTGMSGTRRILFTFTTVLSLSSIYEIVEWGVAEIVEPKAAFAYLGTQGDLFDAQKDTGVAAVGALIGLTMVVVLEKRLSAKEHT